MFRSERPRQRQVRRCPLSINVYAEPLHGTNRLIETADGTLLKTVWAGDGPRSVLLAHGYGFSSNAWNLLAPLLVNRGFRVIAFDQRGHGESTIGSDGISTASMASDYGALVEMYDLRDGILLGHSMGGFLALAFLLEGHPELTSRIGSLMLVGTFAGDVSNKSPQNKAQIPLIKTGALQKALRFGPARQAFTRSLIGDHYDKDIAPALVPTFLSAQHEALTPILEAMVEESRYRDLPKLDLPCTVVVGTEDKTTPPMHALLLHDGIKGSRIVTLLGTGHAPNWECPDKLAALVSQLALVPLSS